MKKRLTLNICLVTFLMSLNVSLYSQNTKSIWLKSSEVHLITLKQEKETFLPKEGKHYQLDINSLRQKLKSIDNTSYDKKTVSISIEFPTINGEIEAFQVSEASVFQKELQQQFPEIRSYIGHNKNATIRFSLSPQKGLSLTYISGEETGFIERKNDNYYVVYKRRTRNNLSGTFECLTEDIRKESKSSLNNITSKDADDSILRSYLLALSVTAEYTEYHYGGVVGVGQEAAAKSAALAGMNATLTRVNGVFERDFGIRLLLINNINDIIYTNPATDPYSDSSSLNNWNTEVQNNLTATIGEANYDIGHLFGDDGGGGNAGCIGCVCVNNIKGSAYTSPLDGIPEGDLFDIDYVSHEFGHQFGANHTWTTDFGPSNEGTGANLEPGSGSTIMGYAGITSSNVQSQGDDYFHFKSIEQVTAFIKTTTCDVETVLSQNAPTVDAGNDYTIPTSTAFILKGQGSSDGNTTFCWEQNDEGGNGGVETSDPSPTNLTGPMFRSLPPTSESDRYMPEFPSVLSGNLTTTWETVSSVGRNMKFKLTARDNIAGGGQNTIDEMVVTVNDASGPFIITSQNTENIIWNRGSNETITWDVANTNSSPVNTSNVDILISYDNGATFSTLLADTPNDGSQDVSVPNFAAPFCRLMIKAVNNIYYAVNSHTFSIDYNIVTTCNTFSDSPNMSITDDASTFDEADIIVPGNLTISEVNISVNVTHTWLDDLQIAINSPDGTRINLIDRSCSDNEDLEVVFDDSGVAIICATPTIGTYLPAQNLSAFNNKSGNGTWTIGINDNAPDDTGVLNSWSVEICTTEVTLIEIDGFFNMYPNPSSGIINIFMFTSLDADVNVSLIDMAGRHIKSQIYPVSSGRLDVEFNYGNISQGIYILKVIQAGNIISRKIIVE